MDINSAMNKGARLLAHDFNWAFPGYYPYEFTTPEEETLAARETAWIGVHLTNLDGVGGRIDLMGPDSVKFMNSIFVNRDFGKMKIGGSRHALMCDNDGNIMGSGLVIKLAEDRFQTSALFFQLLADASGLDISYEVVPDYFIQIDGPKSLEILEDACQCDLHDLKFAQNKRVTCSGKDMLVHRLGMSGALAYEVHGPMEDFDVIYETICASGEKFGAKRQGIRNYVGSNHTPGGYPNQLVHFMFSDGQGGVVPPMPLTGSAADDPKNYLVNPFDLGWENLISYDHEFMGKAALQELASKPHRTAVTLEWNLDDVAEVVAKEIAGTIDADERIMEYNDFLAGWARCIVDKVMDGDRMVGVSGGRVEDYFYHTFISLGFIDQDVAVEGKELSILWGKPGSEQVPIRAKVARFPYYQGEWRNETCDVNALVPKRF